MSEPERCLKEVPTVLYSVHVLSPLKGQMQGFSWPDDDIQRPKHGKREGFVTSCLCLLSPKTGYRSVWTPALVMASIALMATASKQYVSSWVCREELSLSCASWSIDTIQRFLLAVQTITRFSKPFKDPSVPTREQCWGPGPPLGWDSVVYSLLVIYLFSSTKLNWNKAQYHKAM